MPRFLQRFLIISLAALVLMVACSRSTPSPTPAATGTAVRPTATRAPTLPGPGVVKTSAPDPQAAAQEFLQSWKAEDYQKMYGLLSRLSQDAITEADFEKRYRGVVVNMTLKTIDYQVLSSFVKDPASAQASYKVTFHTTLLGDFDRQMLMNLSLEKGKWRIAWEDGMIMPELHGGNTLALDYKIPARGNIYDRNGHAIVAQGDAVALGVIPGQIDGEQESTLLNKLSDLTGFDTDYIHNLYKNAGSNWYVPIGEASAEEVNAQYNLLSGLGGLQMNPFRSRFYYDGGVASQTIGYMLSIPEEHLEDFQRQGYRGDEKVGADGLENWGEQYLAGKHGASLYVRDTQGQIVTRLAQTDPAPAQSIYTTLDKDLQIRLQKSLGIYRGVVIVMERDSGRILAMVSEPGFDPNLFEPQNYNNSYLLNQVLSDASKPLYNRAAQGLYPPGSVFKIITMAAALESKLYTPETTYDCQSTFTELGPGSILYDWTYEFKLPPSGLLTLPEGLMRSCNPYFYHIGRDLFINDHPEDVTKMAKGFGLGAETGIPELQEQAGGISAPGSEEEAVQQAIGQGTTLVTPLQIVRFVAAVGNGGTLYRPQLVEKIAPPDETPSFTFKAEAQGQLPVSPENLKVIQGAMRQVVVNKHGTANYYLANLSIPVAGKTGTAQNPGLRPHAWFVGYSFANRPNKPDIAVVVLVENTGEGADFAVPIFRRAITLYFNNSTEGFLMPWESSPYVVKSPTPIVTDTPAP